TPGSDQLADACAAEVRGWTSRLGQALVQAGFSAQRSEELATVIVSGLEGALLVARLSRNTSALTVTADAMASLLQRPGAPTGNENG
ncbi:MAG: hypothetical protein QOG76_2966, partial [Pseudonocardiales bacterium]|nr:hypothetical protein [Pseudonocardiales bacterium]